MAKGKGKQDSRCGAHGFVVVYVTFHPQRRYARALLLVTTSACHTVVGRVAGVSVVCLLGIRLTPAADDALSLR